MKFFIIVFLFDCARDFHWLSHVQTKRERSPEADSRPKKRRKRKKKKKKNEEALTEPILPSLVSVPEELSSIMLKKAEIESKIQQALAVTCFKQFKFATNFIE